MRKARAAVIVAANEPFEIREYEITEPAKGMCGMELVASGVCGTDIHIQEGKLGPVGTQIIGHEFIGRIDAIDPVEGLTYGLRKGDNVIVDIACPCGDCLLCKTGDDANCVNMGVTNGGNPDEAPYLHGGYCEYSFAPIKNVVKIPEGLDPETVSVFACPGPTGMHAFRMGRECGMNLSKIRVAVVQGVGPVGAFAVMYLAQMGVPEIIAVSSGKNKFREELALKLGATEVLTYRDMTEDELVSYVSSKNGGLGADLIYEASGSPSAVPAGMAMLRNRGLYLIPGQYSYRGNVEIPPHMITFKAIRLIGSSQYSLSDVHDYISFLEEHPSVHTCIKELITRYKVSDVNKAFDDAKAGKNVKTVLVK